MQGPSDAYSRLLEENALLRQKIRDLERLEAERRRTEEKLKSSEAFLDSIIEQSPHPMWISDSEGTLIRINGACLKLLRISEAEVVGKYNVLRDNIVESQGCLPLVRRVFEGGATAHFELFYNTENLQGLELADRAVVVLDVTIFPIRNAAGDIVNAVIQHIDITERKKAERELRKSEQILKATQKLTKIGGWEWDVAAQSMTWTEEAYLLHDFNPGEFVPGSGEHINRSLECYRPEDRPVIQKAFQRCADLGEPYDLEFPFTTAGGRRLWIRTTAEPVLADGRVVKVIGNIMDITDRKCAEEALIVSEERYRKLIESTKDLIYTTDQKGCLTYVNPTLEKTLGYTHDEWKGKVFTQFVAPEYAGLAKDIFKKAMRGDASPVYEVCLLKKDETCFPVEFNVATLYDSEGRPSGRYGIGRDVTDRRLAEESLRESEQHLHRIINGSPIPTFVIGRDHLVIYWNRALEEMCGIRFEEVKGTTQHWRAFYSRERPCLADVLVDEAFDQIDNWYPGKYARSKLIDEAYEATDFFPDLGSGGRWLRFTAAVIRDSHGGIIGAIETLEDITDQKYAEELYRSMADNAQIGVYIVQDGRIVFFNPHIPRYSGYTGEELMGSRIIEYVHPDDRGNVKQHALDMLNGKSSEPYQYRIIDRDGHIKWLMEVVAAIHFKGRQAVLGSTMDITGRILMEKEEDKLKSQLIQAQKMEAIGTLAGGIAHDFNNILAGIIGYTELYLEQVADRPRVYDSMKEVLRAAGRAKDLVKQVLAFSRRTSHEKRPVLLVPIVKEVAKFLRASLPTTIEIKSSLKATSDVIMADPTQMHQVLMNLCANAGQAMKETGGTLEIGMSEMFIGEDEQESFPSLAGGRYLELRVRDTGCGIEPENMGKIFQPYFTTRTKGEGTGLGLAVVHGIVKEHGGEVRAYSEVGKGSTFQVLLPLIEKQEDNTEGMTEAIVSGGGERILFIDDEQALVSLGRESLERLGYRVVAESDPVRALERFKKNRDAFDLVITDKTMPHMTGFDLAREMREIRADIPIILCSGFQDKGDAEKLLAMNINSFLTKPVSKKEMAEAIRNVLDK